MRTTVQEMLEAQHQKDIRDIVSGALKVHRGRRNMGGLVAVYLGVSDATVYNWCETLGIDIDEYRRPAATPTEEA